MQEKNEVTGPKVWVVKNPNSKKHHMTGGYGQPEMSKCFCGNQIETNEVFDPRDIAARDGFQDLDLWCIKCIGLLDFEALDQKIIFSAIDFGNGYFYKDNLMDHLGRSKPKLRLTPPPAIPDTLSLRPQPIISSGARKRTISMKRRKAELVVSGRKCSICNQPGHNKRSCPQSGK
jgi:hypothetical protein